MEFPSFGLTRLRMTKERASMLRRCCACTRSLQHSLAATSKATRNAEQRIPATGLCGTPIGNLPMTMNDTLGVSSYDDHGRALNSHPQSGRYRQQGATISELVRPPKASSLPVSSVCKPSGQWMKVKAWPSTIPQPVRSRSALGPLHKRSPLAAPCLICTSSSGPQAAN